MLKINISKVASQFVTLVFDKKYENVPIFHTLKKNVSIFGNFYYRYYWICYTNINILLNTICLNALNIESLITIVKIYTLFVPTSLSHRLSISKSYFKFLYHQFSPTFMYKYIKILKVT